VDLERIARLATDSREYILDATGWQDTRLGGERPGS
jgi:hypothetical protein